MWGKDASYERHRFLEYIRKGKVGIIYVQINMLLYHLVPYERELYLCILKVYYIKQTRNGKIKNKHKKHVLKINPATSEVISVITALNMISPVKRNTAP